MTFVVQPWQLLCGELVPGQIVDLRAPERFARGHLHGAINVSYNDFQEEALARLERAATVLVVDPAGARAAEMATWLRGQGWQAGYLEGGMAAWTGPLEVSP